MNWTPPLPYMKSILTKFESEFVETCSISSYFRKCSLIFYQTPLCSRALYFLRIIILVLKSQQNSSHRTNIFVINLLNVLFFFLFTE